MMRRADRDRRVCSLSMGSSLGFVAVAAVHLLAQGSERLRGEDGFDGQAKVAGQRESQGEAGGGIAALEAPAGVVGHLEGVGQVLPGEAALCAQNRDPVVEPVPVRIGVAVGHVSELLRNNNILSIGKISLLVRWLVSA